MTAAAGPARKPRVDRLDHVQRIVLRAPKHTKVLHLLLRFRAAGSPARSFLSALKDRLAYRPSRRDDLPAQLSLGLSYRGLEALELPFHVRLVLQKLAPSFFLGAPVQAATRVGDTGASASPHWDAAFQLEALHAVVSLHHGNDEAAQQVTTYVRQLAAQYQVDVADPLCGEHIEVAGTGDKPERWVHFGYRDGLSQLRIAGWSHDPSAEHDKGRVLPISVHGAGEFLLGHPDDAGAVPWALATQPGPVREFFHDASFGVLRQMEQDEPAFRAYVAQQAATLRDGQGKPMPTHAAQQLVQAKLCGRFPDGHRIDPLTQQPLDGLPTHDFDYANDRDGRGCPFGAHMRRMNPRGGDIAHNRRRRPLIRRGTPYGAVWQAGEDPGISRGLLGLFFCSSIENQFEHLLGEWADRVPMGSADTGNAKDPLAAHHENAAARLDLPGAPGNVKAVAGLAPFVRTRGMAYLFYPTMKGIAQLVTEDNGQGWLDTVDRERFE